MTNSDHKIWDECPPPPKKKNQCIIFFLLKRWILTFVVPLSLWTINMIAHDILPTNLVLSKANIRPKHYNVSATHALWLNEICSNALGMIWNHGILWHRLIIALWELVGNFSWMFFVCWGASMLTTNKEKSQCPCFHNLKKGKEGKWGTNLN